jgi:predicted anti-sigma-YlaC factor YlaD
MEDKNDQAQMLELLTKNNQLLADNNEMLHKQERRAKWALVGKVIWFLIIVGMPLLVLYYLQDTLNNLLGVSTTIQNGGIDIQMLLEQYGLTSR